MQGKTKIILTRRSEWLNRFRPYIVLIDNVEVGNIRNGSAEEFPVTPGPHDIQCKLAWYNSLVFSINVEQGSTEYLLVRSGSRYYWLMLAFLSSGILINLFYTGNNVDRPLLVFALQFALIFPSLVYLLYYRTIGRKFFIVIEEDKENVFAS